MIYRSKFSRLVLQFRGCCLQWLNILKRRSISQITLKGPVSRCFSLSAVPKFQWARISSKFCGPLLLTAAYVLSPRFLKTDRNFDNLVEAILQNDPNRLRDILNKGTDSNIRHEFGWTPLLVAAYHGSTECVKVLLEAGAQIDSSDDFVGLQTTALNNGINYLEVVYARDGHFDSRLHSNENFKGTTALHYAVLGNHREVVDVLLKAGADPTVKNQLNHKPVDYAVDDWMISLLENYARDFEAQKKKREAKQRRRFPLEQRIKEKIIGQDGAISTVAAAIRRKENGWYDDEHPLVFLFLGSSGIGKTELAKQVANYLHKDGKKGFIRLDMSEYQQKHEVAKFIGSPPGYVGHDDGGQLTKKLTECPNAVVLFDEVEKAHPDILTIMLQLFDEGRLTDGKGTTVECKNAIFIMTSNLASEEIADHAVQLRDEASRVNKGKLSGNIDDVNITEKVAISRRFKEKTVQPILKRHFKRDEFLGRINEMVYFLPFSKAELAELVKIELEFWKKKAQVTHDIQLRWNDTVVEVLADGYNIRYGARSIKHEVDRRVVNKLAAAHERGFISDGSIVNVVGDRHSESDTLSDRIGTIELEVIDKGSEKARRLNIPLSKSLLNSVGFSL